MRIVKINSRTSVSFIHNQLSNINAHFNVESNAYHIEIAKLDNFKSHNSLNLNLADIDDLFKKGFGRESMRYVRLTFANQLALGLSR